MAIERQRRPTREETKARLLDAAIEVFIAQGISATSVDEIAAAAGFSRGAVYSNFADKDELVLALLQRLSEDSVAEIESLLLNHPDPGDYVRATQQLIADPKRKLGNHHPVLTTELVLYAMRNEAARPLLKERLDRQQAAVWRVIEQGATSLGLHAADNRKALAAMIVAMDDGFGLHAMIDPNRDPIEAFSVALDFLAEAGEAIAVAERLGEKRQPTRASRKRKL